MVLLSSLLLASCASHSPPPTKVAGAPQRLSYPAPRHADVVDDYHGTKVADPFRWMEELDAPETRAWIDADARGERGRILKRGKGTDLDILVFAVVGHRELRTGLS